MTEKLVARQFFDPGGIPLCVFRKPYVDYSRRPHSHDFHEMMIVVSGVAIHHMQDSHVTVSMGDVFLIPPGYTHGYDVPENCGVQVVNVLFDVKRLKMNMRDLEQVPGFHALFSIRLGGHLEPHLKLPAKDLAYVSSLVDEIESEQEEMAPGYEFCCETKFRELILFMVRRYSHVAMNPGKNVLKLGELISYMEKHLNEDIRFEMLAEVAHMSAASVRRAFLETFNCSPMAYLQQLRVKRAMLLLADPLKSISDVAFEVGFNDSGYFTRVFRQETGETPKAFRERL
jgi:AraC-like DNA-binding protein/uncharacterized RmlC-like cupin family protein